MAPVLRPVPLAVAIEAVRSRIAAGFILHDPAGCYTVGRASSWRYPDGCLALLAHTPRADHGREAWGLDDLDRRGDLYGTAAARAFVAAVGPDAAVASLNRTERPWGSPLGDEE